MVRFGLTLLLLGVSVGLVAAPIPKSIRKKNSSIVGKWQVVLDNGQPGHTKEVWCFEEDGTAWAGQGKPDCKAFYTTDDSLSPRGVDWSQDNKVSWYPGIYEVENDQLRINFSSVGKTRLTNFEESGGARRLTLNRMTEDK